LFRQNTRGGSQRRIYPQRRGPRITMETAKPEGSGDVGGKRGKHFIFFLRETNFGSVDENGRIRVVIRSRGGLNSAQRGKRSGKKENKRKKTAQRKN